MQRQLSPCVDSRRGGAGQQRVDAVEKCPARWVWLVIERLRGRIQFVRVSLCDGTGQVTQAAGANCETNISNFPDTLSDKVQP